MLFIRREYFLKIIEIEPYLLKFTAIDIGLYLFYIMYYNVAMRIVNIQNLKCLKYFALTISLTAFANAQYAYVIINSPAIDNW